MRCLWISLLFVLGVVCGGCASDDDAGTDTPILRFVFVTHGQASDPFWSVVQRGALDAAQHTGTRVLYQAPESFDLVTMSQLIDAALASQPDGLVVSIPDADALEAALMSAREAGVPIVSINSGGEHSQRLGSLLHVGQSEYEAGYQGGLRLSAMGATNALCINQEVGNLALDERCRGFTDALESQGSSVEMLAVELGDPTESTQRILAALRSDPSIDALMTLGPTGALPCLRALEEIDNPGINFATFDTSPEILNAIESGAILFAIDQQQYMQGYLPVVLLALYHRNENLLAHESLQTGPGFIIRSNVGRLKELTARGTR
ncbi:MAG: sugar ABC transporter substrate-binding protein [Bacteroidetes bacterium]|nr:sugar ABC transporter substrate-binding protein [Bacteroidota bacterium]